MGDHQHLASHARSRFAQGDVRGWSIRGVGGSFPSCFLPVNVWLHDHVISPDTRFTLECEAWVARTSIGKHPGLCPYVHLPDFLAMRARMIAPLYLHIAAKPSFFS